MDLDDADDVARMVSAAADGDAAAWKELYQRYSAMVWSLARAYLNPDDARDVCQTIWLRLAEHLPRLREPGKVGSWLARVTRNEALLVLRTSRRTSPVSPMEFVSFAVTDETPESAVIETEEEVARTARSELIWQVFQRLDERCRQLLRMLIATPRPSYQEIAEGLGMPVGSIGPTRGRCLKRLRILLAQRGITG
ncbi:sigma-70 family RNA polymerase sigma factor [Streptosporangiaceae bacterium NEAU-GS5]|nr:sigma-70 family RNA polymerase sigma factor [Streptosporangiaceae bacterium NEAU-GS5]